MVDTQSAMNLGVNSLTQVESWVDASSQWESDRDFIDPFFGCSTKLPRLMVSMVNFGHFSLLWLVK